MQRPCPLFREHAFPAREFNLETSLDAGHCLGGRGFAQVREVQAGCEGEPIFAGLRIDQGLREIVVAPRAPPIFGGGEKLLSPTTGETIRVLLIPRLPAG